MILFSKSIMIKRRVIKILGVPIDLGGNHRGVDMGPSAIRVAGLNNGLKRQGYTVMDMGDIHVNNAELIGDPLDKNVRYKDDIAKACQSVCDIVSTEMNDDSTLLVLGGDHSVAMGSVAGSSKYVSSSKSEHKNMGVIWVDAHTDMNTPETSPTGNIHGMPMAALLGYGNSDLINIGGSGPKIDPKNVAFIGIRDVDQDEAELVRKSGVTVFTMTDIDRLGIRQVMKESLEIANDNTAGFHFSFDIDGVDPNFAPGVGTPVDGGLTLREAHVLAEMAYESNQMLVMDLMEVNPIRDQGNKTGRLAVDLALSAFGKTTLHD